MVKATDVPTNDAADEVQSIETDGTGGTFTLTLDATESGNIAFDATAGTVAAALEAMGNIDDVLVSGAGSGADPWVVQFVDPAGNVATLVPDDTLLTGETLGTVVTVVSEGSATLVVSAVGAGQGPL